LTQQVQPAGSIRELDSLGRSFNALTASLQQSDQAKTAFIADVTHELRTPLTVIKGTIETLEDGALDDAEGRGPLLASMQRETERLIRLVNDLLVLTRADAGALKLDIRSLDLAELARSRCETLALLAQSRNLDLQVRPCEGAKVMADADRAAQILDNLLDNAIRHSFAGSTVNVSFQRQGGELQCSVSDSGSGIPAAHLPFIFERFYRAEAARDRQSGGSGLGLAIVRALAQAQGGRVAAESVEGKGTTITFWLPIAS
jgi:two-component system sensor histidine kinase BaeS